MIVTKEMRPLIYNQGVKIQIILVLKLKGSRESQKKELIRRFLIVVIDKFYPILTFRYPKIAFGLRESASVGN